MSGLSKIGQFFDEIFNPLLVVKLPRRLKFTPKFTPPDLSHFQSLNKAFRDSKQQSDLSFDSQAHEEVETKPLARKKNKKQIQAVPAAVQIAVQTKTQASVEQAGADIGYSIFLFLGNALFLMKGCWGAPEARQVNLCMAAFFLVCGSVSLVSPRVANGLLGTATIGSSVVLACAFFRVSLGSFGSGSSPEGPTSPTRF